MQAVAASTPVAADRSPRSWLGRAAPRAVDRDHVMVQPRLGTLTDGPLQPCVGGLSGVLQHTCNAAATRRLSGRGGDGYAACRGDVARRAIVRASRPGTGA